MWLNLQYIVPIVCRLKFRARVGDGCQVMSKASVVLCPHLDKEKVQSTLVFHEATHCTLGLHLCDLVIPGNTLPLHTVALGFRCG